MRHMKWLFEDQSGSTDPMLRNTRRITWYLIFHPVISFLSLISLVLTCIVAVTLRLPSSFGYLSQIRKGSSIDVSQSRGYILVLTLPYDCRHYCTLLVIRLSSSQDSLGYVTPFVYQTTCSYPLWPFSLSPCLLMLSNSLHSNEFILLFGCGRGFRLLNRTSTR